MSALQETELQFRAFSTEVQVRRGRGAGEKEEEAGEKGEGQGRRGRGQGRRRREGGKSGTDGQV